MAIQATNHYVHVKRDEVKSENGGLIIPTTGRIKPNAGEILSVGDLVKDRRIKNGKGKRAIFHSTVGQDIEYNGQTFLILEDAHIIGVE